MALLVIWFIFTCVCTVEMFIFVRLSIFFLPRTLLCLFLLRLSCRVPTVNFRVRSDVHHLSLDSPPTLMFASVCFLGLLDISRREAALSMEEATCRLFGIRSWFG